MHTCAMRENREKGNVNMREQKEDIYTSYSGSTPQPLQDPPAQKWADHTAEAPFGQAPVPPNTPPAYGQPQPPYQPNSYANAPYTPQGNFTPPPYPPNTPPVYGQPQYAAQPYAPGQPPKKKSVGKIVGIVIASVVAVNLLLGVILVAVFLGQSPDKKIEAYEQSGDLADLIAACDIYDNKISGLDDTQTAERYFELALSDTKAFLRAFDNSECADYYTNGSTAYNQMMADWLYLMLQNGQYDKYVSVFTQKMKEYSPSGEYYMDSYAFANFVENGYFELTDEQKQVALRGFDALLALSEDAQEHRMNLKEYYDFCESLGLYDRADEIEQQLRESETLPVPAVA